MQHLPWDTKKEPRNHRVFEGAKTFKAAAASVAEMWPPKKLIATCDIHRVPPRVFGSGPVQSPSRADDASRQTFTSLNLHCKSEELIRSRPVSGCEAPSSEVLSGCSAGRQPYPRTTGRHWREERIRSPNLNPRRSSIHDLFEDTQRDGDGSGVFNGAAHDVDKYSYFTEGDQPSTDHSEENLNAESGTKKVTFEQSASHQPRETSEREEDPWGIATRFPAPLESSSELAHRLRWKQVLQSYYFLDPWNKGYIDVDEACHRLNHIRSSDEALAEFLLQIIEDLIPFLSSRGVVDKMCYLKTVKGWVDEDYATPGPYSLLRSASNPISKACRRGSAPTHLSEKFFEGTYIPRGSSQHQDAAPLDGLTSCREKKIYPSTLAIHGEITKQRKSQTIRRLEDERTRKERGMLRYEANYQPLTKLLTVI